jgi:hypothetical protein
LVWRIHLLSQPTYHYAGAVIPSGQTNLFGSRLSKTMAQEPMGGGGKDTNRHMTARKRQTPNEKLSENRAVRSLSPGFLGSPALANMTEEDIEDAIQTYISSRNSRKKRIVSRSKTLEQRKAALISQPQNTEEERKPRDSLFTRDQEALKEAQRLRSERAKNAYAKRLQNQSQTAPAPRKPRKTNLPNSTTPQDALIRIEYDLDQDAFPAVKDMTVIMKPYRLAKRKDLLRRILSDLFELRGKCVPIRLGEPDSDQVFVTQSSISELGDFVIHLLETKKSGSGTGE